MNMHDREKCRRINEDYEIQIGVLAIQKLSLQEGEIGPYDEWLDFGEIESLEENQFVDIHDRQTGSHVAQIACDDGFTDDRIYEQIIEAVDIYEQEAGRS